MNSRTKLSFPGRKLSQAKACILKFPSKGERKILKAFLLERLHQLFFELFQAQINSIQNNAKVECYTMDNKIIQILIHAIVETGEYTLEGIANYTRIPFDIIYDAACGTGKTLSVTLWTRIVAVYLQVKPDIAKTLINKLLEWKEQQSIISLLLNEEN